MTAPETISLDVEIESATADTLTANVNGTLFTYTREELEHYQSQIEPLTEITEAVLEAVEHQDYWFQLTDEPFTRLIGTTHHYESVR